MRIVGSEVLVPRALLVPLLCLVLAINISTPIHLTVCVFGVKYPSPCVHSPFLLYIRDFKKIA